MLLQSQHFLLDIRGDGIIINAAMYGFTYAGAISYGHTDDVTGTDFIDASDFAGNLQI